MDANTIVWLLLLMPLFSAAIILFFLRKQHNVAALLSTGSAAATFVLAILFLGQEPAAAVQGFPWINLGETLTVTIGGLVDSLSQGMMLIVTGVGVLVHIFSLAYMKDDDGKARYFAGLSIFMFSMTGIVLADNLVMMFIFWELVGLSSYILIGHWYHKAAPPEAAKKAFLTNRIGDFGFMIGILLAWSLTGTVSFSEMAKMSFENTLLLNATVICLFCGAVGKSAQFPLHVWLADAMEGPTPVSALIHAATMVAAGVYMLARVSFLVIPAEIASNVIMYTGAFTALLAALMATQQSDIKKILAYSTLSQLGYMVMAQGFGTIEGTNAGMFHLYTHAFFKALLFLGAGAMIYACHHEQNIWKMGGLRKKTPITFITFVIGTGALIAIPGTSGFFSKEAILETAHHEHHYGPWIIGLVVALLTPFYMTRAVLIAFFGKSRSAHSDNAREVGPIMWVPLAILAFMAIFSAYGFIAHPIKANGEAHVPHFGITAILSVVFLILGVAGAWFLYGREHRDEEPLPIPLFERKFYFDELYLGLVRMIQDFPAMAMDYIDRYVIHGLVARIPSFGALGLGQALRGIQVGNIQGYAFLLGIGIVALIFFLIF